MKRKVDGLQMARACQKPRCIPIGRPRGAKAQGVRYERALAKALPEARSGQWFEFEDVRGRGICQVDLILPLGLGLMGVIEVKYTWNPDAALELAQLYLPVVEMAYGAKAIPLVACRNLIPGCKATICSDLYSAFEAATRGPAVLHWLGVGPLYDKKRKLDVLGLSLAQLAL